MITKKNENLIIWGSFIILSCVFISLCFNQNVWLDEAFTATLVHTSFKDVIARSMADTLPPLYNILLWTFTSIFGYHILVMKLTSVLPMILTLLLGATVVRRRHGFLSSISFMVLLTGMPLMLYYGVEVRMYSLGFLFSTAAGIFAYEVINEFNIKNALLFSISVALAGYSHHFAFVAAGLVYGFLLLYYLFTDIKHLRQWFICLGITIGLYIPCGLVTLKQLQSVSGYFSMPDVDLKLFIQYAAYPFTTGFTPVSLLLILSVIIVIILNLKDLKNASCRVLICYSICCILIYYCVLIFGTIISKIMTANIFVDRYLFFSTGLIWLGVSILFARIENKYIKIALAIIALLCLVTTYLIQFNLEYGNSANEEIAYMKENFKKNDVFYKVEDYEELQYCIPFYTIIACDFQMDCKYVLEDAISYKLDNPDTTLWIVVKDGFDVSDEDLEKLKDNNLSLIYDTDFDFDRYKCKVYHAE